MKTTVKQLKALVEHVVQKQLKENFQTQEALTQQALKGLDMLISAAYDIGYNSYNNPDFDKDSFIQALLSGQSTEINLINKYRLIEMIKGAIAQGEADA